MTTGRTSSIRLSEDGGCSWTDVTFNFPQTLIHDLKYQRGTDDLLYAGTDMGVFYYEALEALLWIQIKFAKVK